MKTINLLLLSFAACLTVASCNRNQYSCDTDVNSWVITHKDLYFDSSREAIVTLPLSRQFALYNSLPAEKKAKLWFDKFNILVNDKQYSREEIAIFNRVKSILKPELFQDDYDDLNVIEFYNNEILGCMGRNTERYFFSVCTWMTREEYLEAVLYDYPVLTRIDGPGLDPNLPCTCRHDIGCFGTGGECVKGGCKIKEKTCGFLGMYDCNGLCE